VAAPRLIGVLALGGLALAAADRLLGSRRAGLDAAAVAAWALALAWLAGVYAMVASYDGNGGHLHPRYLFPGLAVLAVVVALGLDRLPGARRGLWGRRRRPRPAGPDRHGLGRVSHRAGRLPPRRPGRAPRRHRPPARGRRRPWPAVLLGLAGALLAAALGLLAGAVALLAPQPPAPPPPPLAQVRPAGAAVPPTVGSR
jgi:hypothetical protein